MDKLKAIFVAIGSAITSILGALAVPAVLLLAANITDYISAFLCCKAQGVKFTSEESFKGITKKILQWLLVGVGVIVDGMLIYATKNLQIKMPFSSIFACVTAIWLLCNELISILENIAGAGVVMPPFLAPVIKATKKGIEGKMEKGEDNEVQ